MVAGTSTGSIISLGLTVPDEKRNLRPASELVTLYKNSGEIFRKISRLKLFTETARQFYDTVIGNQSYEKVAAMSANQLDKVDKLEQDHAIDIFDPHTHTDLVEGIFGPIGHTISVEELVRPVKEYVKSSRERVKYSRGRGNSKRGRVSKAVPVKKAAHAIGFIKSIRTVDPLEELLRKKFGNKTLNKDIVDGVNVLVPAYNMSKNEEIYFTNDSSSNNYEKEKEIEIVSVIRASTAAPTYFPAKEIDGNYYIDGGIFMNNPAYKAYLEAKRKFPDATKFVLCSLGTGFFRPDLQGLENSGWIWWMSPLIALMMNSSSKLVHDYLENLKPEDLHYYRFQHKLLHDIPLDDTSNETLQELSKIAEEFLNKSDEFKKLIKEIVETKFNGKYSPDDTLVDEQLR
jgi:hypothetical protein